MIYLLISSQEYPRFELSHRGNLQYPVEFKIVRTEKYLRTEPPVELAQIIARVHSGHEMKTLPMLEDSFKLSSHSHNGICMETVSGLWKTVA